MVKLTFNIAEIITNSFRNNFIDGKFTSINKIKNELEKNGAILSNKDVFKICTGKYPFEKDGVILSNEDVFKICTGKYKFENLETGEIKLVEDNDDNDFIELAKESLSDLLEEYFIELLNFLNTTSFDFNCQTLSNSLDVLSELQIITSRITDINKEIELFEDICDLHFDKQSIIENILNDRYNFNKREEYNNITERIINNQPLHYSRLNAKNRIGLMSNKSVIYNIMEITNVNGLHYLPEHQMAQEEAWQNSNIELENLFDTCWNSGWIHPNGKIYGCPDLLHIELSKKLTDMLFDKNIDNVDYKLESEGYIKFSQGRWYHLDEIQPTKEQLELIMKWNEKRDKHCVVYINDKIVKLDLLKSKIENAINYVNV